MKSFIIKHKVVSIVSGLATIFAFFFAGIVYANPSAFVKGVATSTSTSTPTYFAITATTTLAFDAFQLAGTQPSSNKVDTATIGIQLTATSTATVLTWRYEFAIDQAGVDCSVTQTACDWYSDNLISSTNATTTQNIDNSVPFTHTWKFSSSTDYCSSSQFVASSSRGCKLIVVPTPTRYIRVVFYLAPGSANGAIYAALVPTRENNTK